jgi:hypothetical protein
MTYPFPSAPNDLKLSVVLGSYGQTSLINLVGNTYWTLTVDNTSAATPIVIPISLSNFRGKYHFDPAAQTFLITTNTVPLPTFTPLFFSLNLVGQGGGGGGAGGGYTPTNSPGGNGCGGGGGAWLVTNKISYTTNTFSVPSLPTGGGAGGLNGFGGIETSDGAAGGNGSSATIVYAGITYSAGGGVGGNPGFRGQSALNGANANSPVAGGSVTGSNLLVSVGGNNGTLASGGTNGKDEPSGGLGGLGVGGNNGADGYASITWFVE